MFLKAFRVKSSTAIRGSDRRKLRSEVSNAFPCLSQDELSDIVPNKEEMTVTRIMTHSGQNVTFYSHNGEPIFSDVEKRIIPTVYILWKYPDMLPSFETWPPIFEKLRGGADLMLPGIIVPPAGITSFGKFDRDMLCSICLKGNRAPVAVGRTLVSSRDLLEDGMRGKGVVICHAYLDLLWAHGSKLPLPQIDPLICQEKIEDNNKDTDRAVVTSDTCNLSDKEENRGESLSDDKRDFEVPQNGDCAAFQNTQESTDRSSEQDNLQGKRSLEPVDECNLDVDGMNLSEDKDTAATCAEGQQTQEEGNIMVKNSLFESMDDLLEYCFFCALLRMKKVELPVLTSTFYGTYLLPCCPDGSSVDIKKSSYKKLSKFLLCMQEKGIIKVEEASNGVDHISAIAWNNPECKSFKSSRPSLQCSTLVQTDPVPCGLNPPVIEELFSVSAAVIPIFSEFGVRKGAILNQSEVRSTVTNYVKAHELVSGENKRMVVLDPTLTQVLVNKKEDLESLAWDQLFDRVFSKMNHCHQITLPGKEPVVRKGKIETIEIKVEQRMGNKKVTLVKNLESYGIDPEDFAHSLQIKAASSTSVTQLPGKSHSPGMQVLVQGNQVAIVAKFLLDECKIPKKYVSGLGQLKTGKKKK